MLHVTFLGEQAIIDSETGDAKQLHVREWDFPDGEKERIIWEPGDPLMTQRTTAFHDWIRNRLTSMKETERSVALSQLAGGDTDDWVLRWIPEDIREDLS